MKIINFLFAIVMVVSVMTFVSSNAQKRRSTYLFRDRLLELLLEAKQQEYLLNQYEQAEGLKHANQDESEQTFVRRKVVGISDNPF